MNVCPGRAWLTIAITVKLIVSLTTLIKSKQLQILLLQDASSPKEVDAE